ncbi:MAG: glycosyltransferase family 4 protein, partial [Sciscionella sp.]
RTLTVSEVEKRLLEELVGDAVVNVLSNVHTAAPGSATPAGRSGVLFVGSFDHTPNRDAAIYLAREIMPLVRKHHPSAVAHIVGSNAPAEILGLAGRGTLVHGWVADLEMYYRRARVVVAPLRYGAGIKGKIGESLGYGVPVVATPLAVEGMHLQSEVDVLIGSTGAELAAGIARLLSEDETWSAISESGKRALARQFGPEVARQALAEVLGRGAADEQVE